MSKYLDADNPVDMAAVEESYKERVKEAEEYAKEDSEYLLKEINYYRSKSFNEIREDIYINNTNPFLSPEEYYDQYGKEVLSNEAFWHFVDTDDSFDELSKEKQDKIIQEYNNTIPESKKKKIVEKYRKDKVEDVEEQLKKAKKEDILYDMMTEEQIKKYVELYYVSELKFNLYDAREDVIHGHNKLGKRVKGEVVLHDPDIKKIATIDVLEEDSKKYQETKKEIRDGIKWRIQQDVLAPVTMGLIGFGGAGIISVISGDAFINELTTAFGGVCIGLAGVITGAQEIKDIIRDKKTIKRAKEFGIYDLCVDYIKANNLYEDYKDELEEEYLPDDLEQILDDTVEESKQESKEVSL